VAVDQVSESARDKAVRLLTRCLVEDPSVFDLERCVDALIEAARAPESAHTRAATAMDRHGFSEDDTR